MRILMLTPYLPYPPSSGGQVRTYNLLKYLSQKNKITLIALYKFDHERDYVQPLKQFCHQIYLCKRPEKPWQLRNIGRALFSNKPFLIVRNYSKEAKQTAERLLKNEQFDVIHAETFYIMPHLPENKTPVVLVEQTIEYQVYQHFVKNLPKLVQPLFHLDILKLIRWERYYWRKANVVAAVSEVDKQEIRKLEPLINPAIIPNGAGDEMLAIPLKRKNLKQPKLLFIGNFFWLQNVEAANYIIELIAPIIQKKLPRAQVIIAGQNAHNKLGKLKQKGLKVVEISTNDIKTVKKMYQEATLFISPIYGPGGTRLKLLAAMAAGLPIISTRTGIQGLDLKANQDVLLADNVDEFVAQIKKILSKPAFYKKVQDNAFQLVREKYSWQKIAQALEKVYKEIRT